MLFNIKKKCNCKHPLRTYQKFTEGKISQCQMSIS